MEQESCEKYMTLFERHDALLEIVIEIQKKRDLTNPFSSDYENYSWLIQVIFGMCDEVVNKMKACRKCA